MALFVTHELEQAGYAPKYLFTFGQPRLGNSKFLLSIKVNTAWKYLCCLAGKRSACGIICTRAQFCACRVPTRCVIELQHSRIVRYLVSAGVFAAVGCLTACIFCILPCQRLAFLLWQLSAQSHQQCICVDAKTLVPLGLAVNVRPPSNAKRVVRCCPTDPAHALRQLQRRGPPGAAPHHWLSPPRGAVLHQLQRCELCDRICILFPILYRSYVAASTSCCTTGSCAASTSTVRACHLLFSLFYRCSAER